jgi:hypothetical protein
MRSLTVLLLGLTGLRLLSGDIPFFNRYWFVDLAVTICLLVLFFIHYNVTMEVIDNRRKLKMAEPRWRGEPELKLIPEEEFQLMRHDLASAKRVLWVTRRHPISAMDCWFAVLTAYLLLLLSLYLFFVYPQYTVGPIDHILFWDFDPIEIPITTWWWSVGLMLRQAFHAVRVFQRWKWDPLWALTNQYFIVGQVQSIPFPHTKTDFRPISLDQIDEVEVDTGGYWPRFIARRFPDVGEYGTITLSLRSRQSEEEVTQYVMDQVPQPRILAQMLRSVSTDHRRQLSSKPTDPFVRSFRIG